MKHNFTLILIIFFLSHSATNGQTPTYTVTKTTFSSDKYDEFSPVFYKNGLVFCSNRGSGSMVSYSSSQGTRSFNINSIDTSGNADWRDADIFSKQLKTRLNDGPVSFSSGFDTIYYSRNLRVEGKLRDLSSPKNKLGIFYAVFDGKNWTNMREMRFNNDWYNITMPCLSPDGKRLYFASDRPDGYGGADIYYSQMRNGYWDDPVNLGPVVNTDGNESYPFINEVGELFFSSDGHPGLGGKDIFVTKQKGNGWHKPVLLDAPVNSEFDDFGIVTDPLMTEGYFSSNREKTIDIYRFTAGLNQVWFSESQSENQYCFSISDSGSIRVDTISLQYEWDFGDNTKVKGTNVVHCFPGPGNYNVSLNINDSKTGKLFFHKLSYGLEIVDIVQPYISGEQYITIGESIDFDGLKSYLPGYTIVGYNWDFGDGTTGTGEKISHTYSTTGDFEVRLGLTIISDLNGKYSKRAVSKVIKVFRTEQDLTLFVNAKPVEKTDSNDIRGSQNIIFNTSFSAESDFKKEAMFMVELVSSTSRIGLSNTIFRNVPGKYQVKEIFSQDRGTYSYIVDRQMTLMATYPAYQEMAAAGYPDTKVILAVLNDPAEKELFNLKRKYGLLSDDYFDPYNRLLTNGYLMLNQVAALMNKYPAIRIEIAVHTDNRGAAAANLTLSQARAQVMVDYLVGTGMNRNRLVAKGFGETLPVASNMFEPERKLNRRIDINIFY